MLHNFPNVLNLISQRWKLSRVQFHLPYLIQKRELGQYSPRVLELAKCTWYVHTSPRVRKYAADSFTVKNSLRAPIVFSRCIPGDVHLVKSYCVSFVVLYRSEYPRHRSWRQLDIVRRIFLERTQLCSDLLWHLRSFDPRRWNSLLSFFCSSWWRWQTLGCTAGKPVHGTKTDNFLARSHDLTLMNIPPADFRCWSLTSAEQKEGEQRRIPTVGPWCLYFRLEQKFNSRWNMRVLDFAREIVSGTVHWNRLTRFRIDFPQ